MDRRRFFRQGLRELLKPLAKAVEPVERAAHQLGALERLMPTPLPGPWHRPPGARPEREFLSACSRCAKCVQVCPAQCIKIDPTGVHGDGAPYIDPDAMPCVLCDGLLCMPACPTGALVPTMLDYIDMGTAVWHEQICLRHIGEDCTICIDHCPVGTRALELKDGRVHVHEDGCTGCGVCQNQCPTHPKSITITPRSAREGA